MPFKFAYEVEDEYTGTQFEHNSNSDGKTTQGEYRVLLPDGRTQIVKYVADHNDGYNAEVNYEGEARPYEPPQQSYQAPQQAQQSYQAPQQAQQSYLIV